MLVRGIKIFPNRFHVCLQFSFPVRKGHACGRSVNLDGYAAYSDVATLHASQVIDTDDVTCIVVSAKDDVQDANDTVVLQAANQAY